MRGVWVPFIEQPERLRELGRGKKPERLYCATAAHLYIL